jgi:hypothetical protein
MAKKELRRAQKSKKRLKSAQKLKINTPPEINSLEHSQCKLSPLDGHLSCFILSSTLLAKSSTNFVPILSPFGNKLIKHKPREERGAMYENQN